MGRKHALPSVDHLKSVLRLDDAVGRVYWLPRGRDKFHSQREFSRWNARYAGKEAFCSVSDSGYLIGTLGKVKIAAHHVIWAMRNGYWPKAIDHQNGVKRDNTDNNIRDVPQIINARNSARRKDNSSGCPGVNFHKQLNKWHARIGTGSGRKNLGVFDNLHDAIAAKKAAEIEFGYHENHGR